MSVGAMTWHTLYLLPSAPLELAEAVYRYVSAQLGRAPDEPAVGAGLRELREAQEGSAIEAAEPPQVDDARQLGRRRPWELLHVRPDAPPEIVDLAYRYWSERVLGRSVDVIEEPTASQAAVVHEQPATSLAVQDAAGQATHPCLSRAGGGALALSDRPLRLGGDPTCDVVVCGLPPGTEARVWLNDGRVVLHGLGAGGVLVNGAPAGWAVLDAGDVVQVGGETFRFEGR